MPFSRLATLGFGLGLLLSFACLTTSGPLHGQAKEEVKIGMMDNLFEENDENKIRVLIDPFANLVRKQTMTDGTFLVTRGVDKMVEDLKADRLQMGVMHGLDYAWLKEKMPELKPLLIAVNDSPTLKAMIVVPKDSTDTSVEDLRGKPFALNNEPPYHVRFWLNDVTGGDYAKFFNLSQHKLVNLALEEVADKKVAGTAVSNGALDYYKSQNPVRFQKKLKVLAESPEFPAPVMIYKPATVRPQLVDRFRTSMRSAHTTPEGRDTLQLWRLKQFVDVPADYEEVADRIAKRYPRPADAK